MKYEPLQHPFWQMDCRGPALAHKHGEHIGGTGAHTNCPCIDCGLTEARWAEMVRHDDTAALQLPQPGELGVPIMEPRLNGDRQNRYKQWEGLIADYVDGDPDGPGRGELSPAWVEWAINANWVTP